MRLQLSQMCSRLRAETRLRLGSGGIRSVVREERRSSLWWKIRRESCSSSQSLLAFKFLLWFLHLTDSGQRRTEAATRTHARTARATTMRTT